MSIYSNPIIEHEIFKSNTIFLHKIAQLKEDFNGALSSSGFGLSIKEKYIEELDKRAEIIFNNLQTKDLSSKIENFKTDLKKTYDQLYKDLKNHVSVIRGGMHYSYIEKDYAQIKESYIYKIQNKEKDIKENSDQTPNISIKDSSNIMIGKNNKNIKQSKEKSKNIFIKLILKFLKFVLKKYLFPN